MPQATCMYKRQKLISNTDKPPCSCNSCNWNILSGLTRNILLCLQTCSKKDIELLSKVQGTLAFMLNDENVAVQKRIMLCVTQLYKYALQVGGLLSI